MTIKVILFDLDNTLIDRAKVFEEMLTKRLWQYHKDLDDSEFKKVIKQIVIWDNNGNTNRDEVFKKYVDTYQVDVSADELNDYWKNHSGDVIYPFEDALDTLEYLSQKYTLGIVSNGATISQRRKLSKLPFLDMFAYTIVSGEVGYHKPDIRLFNKVCDDLQVLENECVFVGDNYRCDIEGSYQAGMKAIWITKEDASCDICQIIHSLSELKEIL